MFEYKRNTMGIKEQNDLENTAMKVDEVNRTTAIAFVIMAENGSIDEVTASEHMSVFSKWSPQVSFKVGNLRLYGENDAEKLYRCIQDHVSQDDWTPDVAPSLWVVAGDPTVEFPDWSQPIGAQDAYEHGAKVTHNDKHWISTIANNVWEPGIYGWEETE